MRRTLAITCIVLAALLALALAPAAGAAGPAKVRVGKVRLATAPSGRPALLVPVTYPIEMAGRRVRLTVSLRRPDGSVIRGWTVRAQANAGALRAPERRQRFTFVHRVDVDADVADEIRAGNVLHVAAAAPLHLGAPKLLSLDTAIQPVPLARAAAPVCATPPRLRAEPGRQVVIPLPLCTSATRWTLSKRPDHGKARIRKGELIYRSGPGFRGTASIALAGGPSAVTPVQITVGAARAPVVRALGDSVTAGFGYYEEGELMGISSLFSCKPGATEYDDACSSNSKVRSNKVKGVEYTADYGLSNNVSWVAQWANEHGVTNFKNFAVSGSEPSDWFGKGQFAKTTAELASEDPDYVLLTMGANPLLSDMLFGLGNIGCGIWADVFGRFRECLEEEFVEIKLHANLKTLYENLVEETDAEIIVMQYHLSIPTAALYGVDQIAEMGKMMNQEIEAVAAEVSPGRITVVSPPHFNVGLNLAPVYPSKYKCEGEFFSSQVDGPSVQAAISQTVMEGLHPLEFCPQAQRGVPWVISGDTGIHPSAAGYAQMASQVPAPE